MFIKLRGYFLIFFLIILFCILLVSVIILIDFIGIVNVRSKIPKKYMDNKIVKVYLKKSRFLHKNIDDQVLELTIEKKKEYANLIQKYENLLEQIKNEKEVTEKLKKDAQNDRDKAKKELEQINIKKVAFEKIVKEYEDREKRIEEQSLMYSKMDPLRAAGILASLDNELVISIIRKIAHKKSAKIIESMDPKRAAEILKEMSR